MPLVERELHRLARRYMGREYAGHTLQTTALVNEAYLRLIDQRQVEWQNRAHFFGIAAQLMRRILVDHARRRQSARHGGEAQAVSLEEAMVVGAKLPPDLVALDDALKTLESLDRRKSQVVELRFFGGLSVEETAEVLQLSPVTVRREWKKAKAWLYHQLSGESEDDA
jgi:RNA polymerase sigma factor (TIGR02999 family)